jgi:very-short-patch-repair endonuclease
MLGSVTDSWHVDRNSSGKRAESAVDHAIAMLAWRQWGVVTRPQLRALGLSDAEIDYRIAVGRLRLIHRGVYAVGHHRIQPEGIWLAAVYAGGGEAVLSHRSAARLWGLLPWEGEIEVTTPTKRRNRTDIHYIRASVDAVERTVHRAIPVTTVARTLLDLGAVDGPRVPKALEQAEVLRLLDVSELRHLVDRHPRRPGTSALRSALQAMVGWRGITRSELELRFRSLVADAGLPAPEMNCALRLGSLVIEADAVWHDARLIVELDGYAYHRTAAAFERDRQRDRVAVAAGWRVIRITWRQLAERPDDVVADLARALVARSPQ